MANLKYIGKNILNHELEVKSGNIIGDHTEVIRVTVVSDGGNKYAFEGATNDVLVAETRNQLRDKGVDISLEEAEQILRNQGII